MIVTVTYRARNNSESNELDVFSKNIYSKSGSGLGIRVRIRLKFRVRFGVRVRFSSDHYILKL